MNFRKKVISLLMALCLAVSVSPTIAFAAQSKEMAALASYVYVNGVKLTSGSYWKNGDTSRPTGTSSNYNAYFTNGTLYLKNANITKVYAYQSYENLRVGIYSSGNLNINISGTNSITDNSASSIGIQVINGSLSIGGSGSISVCKQVMDGMGGGNTGIEIVEGNLSISDCAVTANAGSNAISSEKSITINNAIVTANGETGTGITAIGSANISNSRVSASGNYNGIYVAGSNKNGWGTLSVSGNSSVECMGWIPSAIYCKVNANGLSIIAGNSKSSAKPVSNFNSSNSANYYEDGYQYVLIYSPSSSTTTPTPSGRFTDVPSNAYYAQAVEWAVENGIVTGMTDTTFEPNSECTRAQVVQMLWAAKGKKFANNQRSPFTDVDPDDWYANAVFWACENGITSGTTQTEFSPKRICTRAQVMTFIWAAQGRPSASGSISFRDVNPNTYYYNVVRWAVNNGITSGTSATTFSPTQNCTRAQIVTFIYKAMA